MPVIITPVNSPADAVPSQKNTQSTPVDSTPVASSAQASPSDALPSVKSAQSSPADAAPSQITTAQDQAVSGLVGSDGVLGYHSARPKSKQSPDDAIPSAKTAQPTPADSLPVQLSAQAAPVDAVPVAKSTQSTPVDAIPSQKTAQATPADVVPVAINPEASPENAAPSSKTPQASPVDAAPVLGTTQSTPADAVPVIRSAQATPANALPVQKTVQSTPANSLPTTKTAETSPSNTVPTAKTAQSTPTDAVPSQKSAQASPSLSAPSQIQTASEAPITGLVGKEGVLGYHSARPKPKEESSVIPFTHPRICYQSFLDTGTVTVSSGDVAAAKNKLTYDKWQPSGTSEWVAVDAGTDVEVDYLAIAAHNLSGRSVQFQYSDTGSTWTAIYSMVADSDKAILVLLNAPLSKRYWRVLVSGSVGISVGVIMIGKALAVQRSINSGHSPITLSRTTVVRPAISERGQWLGRNVIRSGLSTSVAINNLYADWYRANFDPFVESARTEPFFFAWRPETYPDEVALCWTTDDIAPSIAKKDLMNVTFKVDAHA